MASPKRKEKAECPFFRHQKEECPYLHPLNGCAVVVHDPGADQFPTLSYLGSPHE